jgi:hypothetical protein
MPEHGLARSAVEVVCHLAYHTTQIVSQKRRSTPFIPIAAVQLASPPRPHLLHDTPRYPQISIARQTLGAVLVPSPAVSFFGGFRTPARSAWHGP